MRTILIVNPGYPERTAESVRYFGTLGLNPHIVHGPSGREDVPVRDCESRITAVWCAHYTAWQVCLALPSDLFLICEDDARFVRGWEMKLLKARQSCKTDVLLLGSCGGNPEGPPIGDGVVDAGHPVCLHAYMVSRVALETMVRTQRSITEPVDNSLATRTYPLLKVGTMIPPIANQNKEIIRK